MSNELIHWTGRGKTELEAFEVLKTICKEEKLRLTFCPSYSSPKYDKESAMVCFTDIPLAHCAEHCSMFGKFGIAFKKSVLIDYGANPALYTTAKHFDRIVQIRQLLDRMTDLEMDREWKEEDGLYQFTQKETLALQEVMEFLQEYAYRDDDHATYVTYYQREWRLAFKSLHFAGRGSAQHPGMSGFYRRNGTMLSNVQFAPSDIAYLVVPRNSYAPAVKLSSPHGWAVRRYEDEVRD